jgi:hypothetical protein
MTEDPTSPVDVSPPRFGERPAEMPALTPAEQETVRKLVRAVRGSGRGDRQWLGGGRRPARCYLSCWASSTRTINLLKRVKSQGSPQRLALSA